MKILDLRINWNLGWANSPDVEILVDKMPNFDKLVFKTKIIDKRIMFFSNKDGLINYMIRNSDLTVDTEGYGGRHFEILVTDEKGGIKTMSFNGAWSSRSGIINKYFNPHCIECTITDNPTAWKRGFTNIATNIAINYLNKNLEKFCPEAMVEQDLTWDKEIYYRIRRKDTEDPCDVCKGFKQYGEKSWFGGKTCLTCGGTGVKIY